MSLLLMLLLSSWSLNLSLCLMYAPNVVVIHIWLGWQLCSWQYVYQLSLSSPCPSCLTSLGKTGTTAPCWAAATAGCSPPLLLYCSPASPPTAPLGWRVGLMIVLSSSDRRGLRISSPASGAASARPGRRITSVDTENQWPFTSHLGRPGGVSGRASFLASTIRCYLCSQDCWSIANHIDVFWLFDHNWDLHLRGTSTLTPSASEPNTNIIPISVF